MAKLTLTAEAKAAMIDNLELELKTRIEKLQAMCEAQCASLRSRLERRVNRIPAAQRQKPLVELLAPPAPAPQPAPVKAGPPPKTAAPKKAPAPKKSPAPEKAPAPVTRKARPAPASKPALTKPAPKQTATRTKKRGSDEMSSEDKENAALDVPKKRVRAAAQKPAPAVTKPAPTTRTTRAASRQKPAAAQILSPKNNNARQKPAKPATRPR